MVSALFNKKDADEAVINSLLRELRKARIYYMPIVKTTDGKYYRVEADQEVSAEDVQNEVNELQAKVTELQAVIAPANAPAETAPSTDAPAQPVASTPTDNPPVADPATGTATVPAAGDAPILQ